MRFLLVAALVGLAACGGDGSPSAVTQEWEAGGECSSWTEQPVTSELVAANCMVDGGVMLTTFYECVDGRRLAWNDAVWGFIGERFKRYIDGADHLPPDDETAACLGS